MEQTARLLSPLLPLQLFMKTARALGKGGWALDLALRKMSSKDSKDKVFAGYEPTEHDVFATCFSKSGTNWCMHLIAQVAYRGAAEFEHIHHLAPWPEGKFPGMASLRDPATWERPPTGLRPIKTNLEAEYVPYSPKAKYVCVARDPKELQVSAYYFLTGVFGLREHITPEQWFEMANKPGSLMAVWPEHMAGYWQWRDRPNVRVLFYADMKKDLPGTVDQIAELMEVELSEQERAEVIRKCGFEYMKTKDSCFAPPRMPLLTGKQRGQMIRKGQAGKSSELLSEAQRAQIDQLMLAGLAELGSDFPYQERFMAS